jgi:hypothetical protein
VNQWGSRSSCCGLPFVHVPFQFTSILFSFAAVAPPAELLLLPLFDATSSGSLFWRPSCSLEQDTADVITQLSSGARRLTGEGVDEDAADSESGVVDLADPRWKALGQEVEEDLGWGDADDEAEGEGQPDPDTPLANPGPEPAHRPSGERSLTAAAAAQASQDATAAASQDAPAATQPQDAIQGPAAVAPVVPPQLEGPSTPPPQPAPGPVAVAASVLSTTPYDSGTSSWDDAGAPITEEERRRARERALAPVRQASPGSDEEELGWGDDD